MSQKFKEEKIFKLSLDI